MRSAYLDYKREDSGNGHGISALEQQLREACRIFSSRFINYHFLDETLLEKYGYVSEMRHSVICRLRARLVRY